MAQLITNTDFGSSNQNIQILETLFWFLFGWFGLWFFVVVVSVLGFFLFFYLGVLSIYSLTPLSQDCMFHYKPHFRVF